MKYHAATIYIQLLEYIMFQSFYQEFSIFVTSKRLKYWKGEDQGNILEELLGATLPMN